MSSGCQPSRWRSRKRRQQQQATQKKRIRASFCVISQSMVLITLLLLATMMTHAAASSHRKWLQHRLRQIAAQHMESSTPRKPLELPQEQQHKTLLTSDSTSKPLLVVATNDGQVWTIDATDGSLVAGFSTGPPLLILDDLDLDHDNNDNNDAPPLLPTGLAQSRIVPSMDGMLYWRQPIQKRSSRSSSSSTEDDHSDSTFGDEREQTKLIPIASIRDLVDSPLQICQDEGGQQCDILTATSLGPSLFSMNAQGSLNWARARTSSASSGAIQPLQPQQYKRQHSSGSSSSNIGDDDENNSDSEGYASHDETAAAASNLLLQRQDYLVEQISTRSGEQVWNITWGSLEALDFFGQGGVDGTSTGSTSGRFRGGEGGHYLPSGDDRPLSLPSLVFSNQGRGLVALWTQPPKFLWKQEFMNVVTNVLGIEHNTWQAVSVVTDQDSLDDDDDNEHHDGLHHHQHGGNGRPPKLQPRLLASQEEAKVEREDLDRWYMWWVRGRGKKQHIQVDADDNKNIGVKFLSRPNEEDLLRDNWYVNKFSESAGKELEQFHGYRTANNNNMDGDRAGNSERRIRRLPELYEFYDPVSIPRLLLLPDTSRTASTGLPAPHNSGGVFLSWSVVLAILSLLVGSAGAVYILYGHKKRKWLANQSASTANSTPTDSSSNTPVLRPPTSWGRDASSSQDGISAESRNKLGEILTLSTSSSQNRRPRQVLNRSSSAPMMAGDQDYIDRMLGYNSEHESFSRLRDGKERAMTLESSPPQSRTVIAPNALVKHQSAPVATPDLFPQGGVGMIDGIPLIRYSRYQSEFRELEPLGRGGFGSVFRVVNVLDSREYAVKKVSIRSSDWNSPGTEAFSQELHRVLREVKFLALLDHPNIVRYYTAWLEMEEHGKATGSEEKSQSRTLSRRYSSGLLTGTDDPPDGESQQTQSLLGNGISPSMSRATVSHLRGRNATNPLGWNNDFGNFDESSASAYHPKLTMPVLPAMEDCGFIFEGSNEEEDENTPSHTQNFSKLRRGRSHPSSDDESDSESHSLSSSWDASYSLNRRQNKNTTSAAHITTTNGHTADAPPTERKDSKLTRHTLYIQMQLCSSKTLGDFLSNKEARKGPSGASSASGTVQIDIPWALRHFLQIVRAVQHVHQQGLIHRDLKPSNCFIDDTGVVKVGDFGLSRESNDSNDQSETSSLILDDNRDDGTGDNTIGVGTRSYASPEQMVGSDYDSKTDIYALGIMLFELLYPMYTGMERHICFQNVRNSCKFPDLWEKTVAVPFPTLDELVKSMLSLQPKDRPTADRVARHIQNLLDEHSVTLNISHQDDDSVNIIFVRVEAKPLPDILKSTIQFIHDASLPHTVDIVQYGMRSSTKGSVGQSKLEKRAILEFALLSSDVESKELQSALAATIVTKLEEHDEIIVARHVWHRISEGTTWNRQSPVS